MAAKGQSTDLLSGSEIFLSYAVADKPLANRLSERLEGIGQDVWIDSEDIRYAEDWRDAVFPAIERAPAVLFITSPASLSSVNCLEELHYASSLGKRIIPIVAADVERVPDVLKNRVRRDFRDEDKFDEELRRLAQDVTADPEYVDGHTHLAYRAARWHAEKTGLLGAKELERAREWMTKAAAKPNLEPHPTELITNFIEASRRARMRSQVKTAMLILVAVFILGGGYFGVQWWLGIPTAGISVQLQNADDIVWQRTGDRINSMRDSLQAIIPDKRDRTRLLIATWNIRDLGRHSRSDEALHYIAEIISHFDIVAIQELKGDMTDFDRIRNILGRGWLSAESDINEGRGGNQERLAFLFDSRKVSVGRLIGELDLTEAPQSTGPPYRSPYFVGFQFAGIDLAICNVHLRWGRNPEERPLMMQAIAAELSRKVERGRDFPSDLVLLGDVQAGSAGGRVLDAIEGEGFVIPDMLRELSTMPNSGRPYDQIALMLDSNTPLRAGKGGAIEFYRYVYREDEEEIYDHQIEVYSSRDYSYRRNFEMSDHYPKWLELAVAETAGN